MQEGVRSAVPRTVTRKKTDSASDHQEEDVGRAVAESLPKNLIAAHPVQGSQEDEGSGDTCSPATPCAQRYGTGKPEGESQETGSGRDGTDAVTSPPPSKSETLMIMWI